MAEAEERSSSSDSENDEEIKADEAFLPNPSTTKPTENEEDHPNEVLEGDGNVFNFFKKVFIKLYFSYGNMPSETDRRRR